jgi:hypothetical protein
MAGPEPLALPASVAEWAWLGFAPVLVRDILGSNKIGYPVLILAV